MKPPGAAEAPSWFCARSATLLSALSLQLPPRSRSALCHFNFSCCRCSSLSPGLLFGLFHSLSPHGCPATNSCVTFSKSLNPSVPQLFVHTMKPNPSGWLWLLPHTSARGVSPCVLPRHGTGGPHPPGILMRPGAKHLSPGDSDQQTGDSCPNSRCSCQSGAISSRTGKGLRVTALRQQQNHLAA